MTKISDIIKLKLKDKTDLGDWYKDRLEICNGCTFNSKNLERKKNFVENLAVLASANKDICTICKCTLVDKASGEFEECPKGKWPNIEEYEED